MKNQYGGRVLGAGGHCFLKPRRCRDFPAVNVSTLNSHIAERSHWLNASQLSNRGASIMKSLECYVTFANPKVCRKYEKRGAQNSRMGRRGVLGSSFHLILGITPSASRPRNSQHVIAVTSREWGPFPTHAS